MPRRCSPTGASLHKKFVKVMPRDYKRALAADVRRREDSNT